MLFSVQVLYSCLFKWSHLYKC